MKISNNFRQVIGALFVLLILAGCNSSTPPYQLNDMPKPLDLKVYEGSTEVTFDTLIAALSRVFDAQAQKLETQYYWMDEPLEWDQIEQFYQAELADTGWQIDNQTFNTTRWVKDSTAGEQRFVVSSVPLVNTEGHILLLMLASD